MPSEELSKQSPISTDPLQHCDPLSGHSAFFAAAIFSGEVNRLRIFLGCYIVCLVFTV